MLSGYITAYCVVAGFQRVHFAVFNVISKHKPATSETITMAAAVVKVLHFSFPFLRTYY